MTSADDPVRLEGGDWTDVWRLGDVVIRAAGPWSQDGAAALGVLLRNLHRATATFRPPAEAAWFPWHGRDLGGKDRVIGHCDVAPWNIVARREQLPAATDRAGQLAAIVDGYGLDDPAPAHPGERCGALTAR